MNNIKTSVKVTFDPGAVKATPVRATSKSRVSAYANGVPAVVTKAPTVLRTKLNLAVFNPGAVKAPPVQTKAKAKVSTVRAYAAATVRERSYVTRTTAKAHVSVARPATVPRGKPRDRKMVFTRCTHVPPALPAGTRNYVTTKHATAHVLRVLPLVAHDRKIAYSKATFGSFNPGRGSKFGWR